MTCAHLIAQLSLYVATVQHKLLLLRDRLRTSAAATCPGTAGTHRVKRGVDDSAPAARSTLMATSCARSARDANKDSTMIQIADNRLLDWTGPLEGDLVSRRSPLPPEHWPYGPPSAHEACCRLHRAVHTLYCDCKASAADEDEWGATP